MNIANKKVHQTGTRKEWLAARLELLQAEKEHTRRGDELAKQRRELPWIRMEKNYQFDTEEGKVSLAGLFKGRSQLVVYHFMFGPDYTAGCPACSATADSFNGVLAVWTHSGACINGLTALPRGAMRTSRAFGGACTTNTAKARQIIPAVRERSEI
jgi:predicted dithiol-disulfide oxidoreductase (DUF899 family)